MLDLKPAVALLLLGTGILGVSAAVAQEATEPTDPATALLRELAELRPAFQRCAERETPLTEGFGECACSAVCRHAFEWPPVDADGSVTLRLPFIDVDGLVATIEPGGRVLQCRYDVAMEEVSVQVLCPEE